LIPRQFVHFPIDAATCRSNGATAFTPARLDKPLRLTGAAKTAKAQWGGLSLQSLLQMSHGYARSTRGSGSMPVEMIGVL
jgi:hypothetical protein